MSLTAGDLGNPSGQSYQCRGKVMTHLDKLWAFVCEDWSDHTRQLIYADALDEAGETDKARTMRRIAANWETLLPALPGLWTHGTAELHQAMNVGILTPNEIRRALDYTQLNEGVADDYI